MQRFTVDTNIAIYAYSEDARRDLARRLLANGPVISVQLLNEFVNVSRRKLKLDWPLISERLALIKSLSSNVAPLTDEVHLIALDLAQEYRYSIYDSLMLAVALEANCDVFLQRRFAVRTANC